MITLFGFGKRRVHAVFGLSNTRNHKSTGLRLPQTSISWLQQATLTFDCLTSIQTVLSLYKALIHTLTMLWQSDSNVMEIGCILVLKMAQ
nr:hypothetical protein Iba_scaffold82541CG0010 [Ipomoea batatas]